MTGAPLRFGLVRPGAGEKVDDLESEAAGCCVATALDEVRPALQRIDKFGEFLLDLSNRLGEENDDDRRCGKSSQDAVDAFLESLRAKRWIFAYPEGLEQEIGVGDVALDLVLVGQLNPEGVGHHVNLR